MDLSIRRFFSKSPDDTMALAAALGKSLGAGDLVALKGDLGAGKTTFVRGLANALSGGEQARVSSPTFAVTNLYPTSPRLCHFDFYRLSGLDDLESTGFWDYIEEGESIVVVEWADRISAPFDASSWFVKFELVGEMEREITLAGPEQRLAGVGKSFERLMA